MTRRRCCCVCPPCDAIAGAAETATQNAIEISDTRGGFDAMPLVFDPAHSPTPPWYWQGTTVQGVGRYTAVGIHLSCTGGLWHVEGWILSVNTFNSCYWIFDKTYPCVVPSPITLDVDNHFVGSLRIEEIDTEQTDVSCGGVFDPEFTEGMTFTWE
jgi:hypothetical protein